MKKRMISLMLAVMLALSVASVAMASGTSAMDAIHVDFGTTYKGSVTKDAPKMFYEFDVESTGRVTFKAMAGVQWIKYYLYDAQDLANAIWYNSVAWNSVTEMSNTVVDLDVTAGTYYLAVLRDTGEGDFSFSLSYTAADESFPSSGYGINNSLAEASKIELGQTYSAQLSLNDRSDFYEFTLETSGKLTLNATSYLSRIHYYINDVNGIQIMHQEVYADNVTKSASVEYTYYLAKGTYYLVVNHGSYTGEYNFKFTFEPSKESFPESWAEPNEGYDAAVKIGLNHIYRGQFGTSDDKDFYMITLPVKDTIVVHAYGQLGYLGLQVLSSDKQQLLETHGWDNNATNITILHKSIELDPGTYYVVTESTSDGYYDFYVRAASGFTDMDLNSYYTPAVSWALSEEVTTGTSDTTFEPVKTVTRAEAVTFLWRAKGSPEPKTAVNPFTDVKSTDWYYKAVLWANETNITNGKGLPTTFQPNASVSRGEMIVFLWRTMDKPGNTNDPVWYADAEKWAIAEDILSGTLTAYETDGICPRSDVVYYLWEVLESK